MIMPGIRKEADRKWTLIERTVKTGFLVSD
jgi:hypothetical protein